jgi:hypothetical protein
LDASSPLADSEWWPEDFVREFLREREAPLTYSMH